MDRRHFIAATGSAFGLASSARAWTWSWRGAILHHAVPGVGSTGNRPPREIRLGFDRGVIAAASRVQVADSKGAEIPARRPVNDPADPQVIIVRLRRALPPGTYAVRWYVVSVDRHQAMGNYHFTVS
jgi:methionine-rich copper-binding protein CopC